MSDVLFPGETVILTPYFDVHQDREVPIPGFLIVESLRKLRSIAEFSDAEAHEFSMLIRELRRQMQDVLGIQDVYLFQNEDSEHGFHLWMFPRHDWMEQFGRKIQSVRPIMNHAKEQRNTPEERQKVREAVAMMKETMSKSSAFSSSAS